MGKVSDEQERPVRLIDRHELLSLVPYSIQHIGRMEKAGTFPKRVKMGPARVAWRESEVQAWIAARVAERDDAA